MTTTTGMVPTVYAASYPAFPCCLCTIGDEHRHVLISRPLYAQAVLCPGCNHTICYDHRVRACGLCLSCCWEQHGSHVADDRP